MQTLFGSFHPAWNRFIRPECAFVDFHFLFPSRECIFVRERCMTTKHTTIQ